MSYFEARPEPEPYDAIIAEWYAPPADELGTEVGINRVLASSTRGRISLRSMVAFSTGFELHLLAEWSEDLSEDSHGLVLPHSDHFVRVAVEFADGGRTTNMDYPESDDDEDDDDQPPAPPFMGRDSPQSMQRRSTARDLELWIWPIPAEGDVTLVCEWIAAEIPVAQTTIAGDDLRDAARQSQRLW